MVVSYSDSSQFQVAAFASQVRCDWFTVTRMLYICQLHWRLKVGLGPLPPPLELVTVSDSTNLPHTHTPSNVHGFSLL